jgi:hypothetical protein
VSFSSLVSYSHLVPAASSAVQRRLNGNKTAASPCMKLSSTKGYSKIKFRTKNITRKSSGGHQAKRRTEEKT